MADKVNILAQVLLDAFNERTRFGEDFEDFIIFDEYPADGSLHFPCVIVLREPAGTADDLFGGVEMRAVTLVIEVAFKEKSGFVAREHDYLSTEKLVMWYEERLNELVRDLVWDAEVPVDSIQTVSERHFPQEKNQELFGLTYRITIKYADTGE